MTLSVLCEPRGFSSVVVEEKICEIVPGFISCLDMFVLMGDDFGRLSFTARGARRSKGVLKGKGYLVPFFAAARTDARTAPLNHVEITPSSIWEEQVLYSYVVLAPTL